MNYGWIEIGVQDVFSNVQCPDVVFRTATTSNKIVIGNDSGQDTSAALYVKDNQVGIHQTPLYDLDVSGVLAVRDDISMMHVTSSNLRYTLSDNSEDPIIMTSKGAMRVHAIATKYCKIIKAVLENVPIFAYGEEYDLQGDLNQWISIALEYSNSFKLNKFIFVQDRMFIISQIDIVNGLLKLYLKDTSTYGKPTLRNETHMNIYLLEDVSVNEEEFHTIIPLYVKSICIDTSTNKHITVNFTIVRNTGIQGMIGRWVNFRSDETEDDFPVHNAFFLEDIDVKHHTLRLSAIEGLLDFVDIEKIFGILPRLSFMYVLDITVPHNISDTSVVQAQASRAGTLLKLSSAYMNPLVNDSNNTSALDYVTLQVQDSCYTQVLHVARTNKQNDSLYLTLPKGSMFLAGRFNLVFHMSGFPLLIQEITQQSEGIFNILAYDMHGLKNTIKAYIGNNLFVHDDGSRSFWKILYASDDSINSDIISLQLQHETGELSTNFSNVPRIVYVIGLRCHKTTRIATQNDDMFIKGRVGIQTKNITEDLTVNGSISARNRLTFYDSNNDGIRMDIKYNEGSLHVNEVLCISSNDLHVHADAQLLGQENMMESAKLYGDTVVKDIFWACTDSYAEDKKTLSDPRIDLENLSKLSVYDFNTRDGSMKKAFDLDEVKNTLPNAVHDTTFFVPNICMYARRQSRCELVMDLISPTILSILQPNKELYVKHDVSPTGTTFWKVYHVAHIKVVGSALSLHLCEEIAVSNNYYVYGTKEGSKAVDTNLMLLSCVNAFKQVMSEVETLRDQMQQIETINSRVSFSLEYEGGATVYNPIFESNIDAIFLQRDPNQFVLWSGSNTDLGISHSNYVLDNEGEGVAIVL